MNKFLLNNLNLNRFMDAPTDGGVGGGTESTNTNTDTNNQDTNKDNKDTDTNKDTNNKVEFTKEQQDAIDKLISDRINKVNNKHAKEMEQAKAKWEEELTHKQKMDKINNMPENEKNKALLDEANSKLSEYEKRIADYETKEFQNALKSKSSQILSDKGLDTSLVDLVDLSSEDNCLKSIETLEKVFNSALDKAINERLKTNTIPKVKGDNSPTGDADIDAYMKKHGLV